MAVRKPLVLVDGEIQQLQSSDSISVNVPPTLPQSKVLGVSTLVIESDKANITMGKLQVDGKIECNGVLGVI